MTRAPLGKSPCHLLRRLCWPMVHSAFLHRGGHLCGLAADSKLITLDMSVLLSEPLGSPRVPGRAAEAKTSSNLQSPELSP